MTSARLAAPKHPETPWHARTAVDTATELGLDVSRGLGAAEAAERLQRDGPNEIEAAKPRSAAAILLHQFQSIIVGLLFAASGIAFWTGDTIEAVAILVVLVLNAAIGFVSEWKAAGALEGLRRHALPVARVRRDGQERLVAAGDLVVGDIVLLTAGDRVPADGRVIEHAHLHVDEAALTGESLPVAKSIEAIPDNDVGVGDRLNMVHTGTAVTKGRGAFAVTTTGGRTELGRISALTAQAPDRGTPLEAKLSQLSRALLVLVLLFCLVIVLVGWLRGYPLASMVEVGLSLAIAAVPEGLLAVTTMTLAVGMQRMARMKALVRRLPAVEALGGVTIICSDKTGTLTKNEMTVRAVDVGGRRFTVTGSGYQAEGTFEVDGQLVDPRSNAPAEAPLLLCLRIGALCNDAKLDRSTGEVHLLGDPTEAALLVVADKAGLDRNELTRDFPRTAEVPFDSDTKRMVTVHRLADGKSVAYVKGSPSAVLANSVSILDESGVRPLSEEAKQQAARSNEELAGGALRVLGLAYRELPEPHRDEDLHRDLIFVGLVGMVDPLREEAHATVAACRTAGIRVVMITGDQPATAAEIGKQLGLDTTLTGEVGKTVHARELRGLSPEDWQKITADATVFARVSPEDKLDIVDALQRRGEIVAMTGDGVNDAPGLRQADIGIALGLHGTEVAKEAADVVITDDDFSTIVRAVEQGRIVVHNLLRFIHYLFSCNLSEIVTIFAAVAMGWPLPLGVLQILWLNLVTDIFPAMALALEPSAPDVMTHPPRPPNEPLMTPRFGFLIVWQGVLLAGCTLASFAVGMRWYGRTGTGLAHAVTITFMTLAMAQIFHAFNARSRTRSAFTSHLGRNAFLWGATAMCLLLQVCAVTVPGLRQVLHTSPLSAPDWGLVAAASLAPVAVVEAIKLLTRGARGGARGGTSRGRGGTSPATLSG